MTRAKLGEVRGVVALDGRVTLAGGGFAPAHLVLTGEGLFLADWTNEEHEVQRALLGGGAAVRYESGRLTDRLFVDDESFAVPRGKGSEVKELLGLAFLGLTAARNPSSIPDGATGFDPISRVEGAWLARFLDPDERVLAWLHAGPTVSLRSELAGGTLAAEPRLVLTDARAAVVAVTELGDADVRELPAVALEVSTGALADTVSAGSVIFQTSFRNRGDFRRVAPLAAMESAARMLEAAGRIMAGAGTSEQRTYALGLLDELADRGDPRGRIAKALASEAEPTEEADRSLALSLRSLVEDSGSDAVLLLARAWGPGPRALLRVADLLGELDTAEGRAGSIALRQYERGISLSTDSDMSALVGADLEFARHLVTAGQRSAARELLERRAESLPRPEVLDLLAPSMTESASSSTDHPALDGQAALEAVLQALVHLRGESGAADVHTLRELARLSPLQAARHEALAIAAEQMGRPDLANRARALVRLLRDGPAPRPQAAPSGPAEALGEVALAERLRHPAAREGHVFDRLGEMLAKVEVPDHSALSRYCERVSGDAEVVTALADASHLLGTSGVEAYVSRGEDASGIRGHEGSPPFVLLGQEHLSQEGDLFLHPLELRFAIGAEVAHLKFGHARLTSTDVWSGVFETGKTVLDVALGIIPILGSVGWATKLGVVGDVVQKLPLESLLGFAGAGKSRESHGTLGVDGAELLAAHRVMQFTADRAGLVLAQDIRAAVRAVFLTWPTHHAELPSVMRHGLAEVLLRRDGEGQLLRPNLAVRISALASFWLSDDYEELVVSAIPSESGA